MDMKIAKLTTGDIFTSYYNRKNNPTVFKVSIGERKVYLHNKGHGHFSYGYQPDTPNSCDRWPFVTCCVHFTNRFLSKQLRYATIACFCHPTVGEF